MLNKGVGDHGRRSVAQEIHVAGFISPTVFRMKRWIESAAGEWERYLRIAETLESSRDRLRASTEALDLIEKKEVLRPPVEEVLVGVGEITICHATPATDGNGPSHGKPPSKSSMQNPRSQSYLPRWGSRRSAQRDRSH